MFPKHLSSPARVAGGILLSGLLVGGCATEQAMTEQTQPLKDQLVRLEKDLAASQQASAQAARAQSQVLSARQTALEREVANMGSELQSLRGQVKALDDRLGRVEQTVGRMSASLSGQAEQSSQRLDRVAATAEEAARQVAALRTRQDEVAAAAQGADAALSDRLAGMERRLRSLNDQVLEAMALAAKDIFLAHGKEAYTVTLTEDRVLFPQNDPALDGRDAAKLDDLAARVSKLDQEYHLDIQGHTDNTGTEDINYHLGKARAEVVKRYLHEKQGISINRMSTISYGASKPLDPAGGPKRRIFIRVLVLK